MMIRGYLGLRLFWGKLNKASIIDINNFNQWERIFTTWDVELSKKKLFLDPRQWVLNRINMFYRRIIFFPQAGVVK
jgi:hypothetical protein